MQYCFSEIPKGDTFPLEITVRDSSGDLVDITGWTVRAELFDKCGHCIRIATTDVGGNVGDVELTDPTNGVFCLIFAKDLTTCFEDIGYLEIEVENTESPTQKITICNKNNSRIDFISTKICWETIDE